MNAHAGVPLRPLALLALAVLGAHLLVLRGAPPALSWPTAPRATTIVRLQFPDAPAVANAKPTTTSVKAVPASRPAAAMAAAPQQQPAPAPPSEPRSATPPGPLTAPGAARWRYAVLTLHRGVLLEGQGVLDWQPTADAYEAVLRTEVPGLPVREQRSSGGLPVGEGLRPQRYADRNRGEQAAHFEQSTGQVLFSGNQPPVALEAGAQDRVSVLLQLLALARSDPARLVPGATLTLQVAGTRGAEPWTFVVERWEALDLPAGRVRALKLARAPQREYDLRMETWIAPDYGPVRLRLTPPNGDWLDLQWSGTDKG